MSKINVFVWHTMGGRIVAIGHATGQRKVVAVAREGQAVLETEIEEAQIGGLHKTHLVDVGRRALVKRPT
jgi:predicted signal transduction protein with EAL and GGDEF domain